jgi:hypothetical protein
MPTLLMCEDDLRRAVASLLPGRALSFAPSLEFDEESACAALLCYVERARPAVVVLERAHMTRLGLLRAGWMLIKQGTTVVGVGGGAPETPERQRRAYALGIAAALDITAWSVAETAVAVADHVVYARAWSFGRAPRLPLASACSPLRARPRLSTVTQAADLH